MSRSKSNKNLDSLKKEDVVQAVIVADNFSDAFVPMTNDIPSCLLPLVNTCLLDHTLEWLSNSGVQEAFLFCSRHVEKVKEHIRNSKWSCKTCPLSLHIIVSETCLTLGDAMRDLDAKGLIRGDFILVMGDTVANVNLLPILEKHRKLQKVDKGLAMTVVYKYAGPSHLGRAPQDDLLVAVDKRTSKVLFHQKRNVSSDKKKVHIPMEVIMDRPLVDIYNDMIDTHISICSVSVLPLFSDNFDFQTREDFIKGVLMNEEILASSLAAYCLSDREFAASVNSWHMYKNVTQNMIHRWTFPLVPDMLTTEKETYQYLRGNVYKQPPVTLSRSSIIEDDSVIGGVSKVGENSTIRRSVVGRNCQIGDGVKIEDSYIWDGCIIEDNCSIQRAVVGTNCVVGEGANLSQGCILGQGVQCPPKYSCSQRLQSSPGDEELEKVGEAAYIVQLDGDDSDSEDGITKQIWNDLYNEYFVEEIDGDSDTSSETIDASDRSVSPVLDDTNLFYNEVVDSLKRGYEDKLHCDNLILEINSSRYAYNVSMQEVNLLVVKAILNLPKSESDSFLSQLWPLLTYFMPIFKNYIRNPSAQIDCLQALKEVVSVQTELLAGTAKLLNMFYSQDILSEEVILKWYSDLKVDPDVADLCRVAGPFIKWLEEAEEESEEDSD